MPTHTISYTKAAYFTKLICNYLAKDAQLKPFINRFPEITQFEAQINEKSSSFSRKSRDILVDCLQKQYKGMDISKSTENNISSLSETNTFTITTGHQLNLFTGPLYFLYKIFSIINLSEVLKKEYPGYHFVPVFWMASEDHDFEEINYFNINGKKIQWDHNDGGAVGRYDTNGLEEVYKELKDEFGGSKHAKYLLQLFSEAYLKHKNLADATRFLGNELFKEYGLVIVDGDDASLKRAFIPFASQEIQEQFSSDYINATTTRLEALGYPAQVHPREINLFYLGDGFRERIIEKNGIYYINNREISFSPNAILKELEEFPERFSPNALLRPLYQEVILPNLCYVGGGGELAYWFQLKDYFNEVRTPFPILLLRNSVLLLSEKLSDKLEKLNVSIEEIFLPLPELKNLHTKRISEIKIDFGPQRDHLKQQFASLYELAKKTDASFVGAVAAQEKKQLNGLNKLEKRLLKAQRRKHQDELSRIASIRELLFPENGLQERNTNFSEFYISKGPGLFEELKEGLDPLVNKFTVIRW